MGGGGWGCFGGGGVNVTQTTKQSLRTLPITWSQGLGLAGTELSSSAPNLPPVSSHVVEVGWDLLSQRSERLL